jgi:hypothetical protein
VVQQQNNSCFIDQKGLLRLARLPEQLLIKEHFQIGPAYWAVFSLGWRATYGSDEFFNPAAANLHRPSS